MKRISLMILGVLAMFTACQEPEHVKPTADRQGLTSLTAIFTSGPFVDKDAATLYIEDETADTFIIPIPWFWPESSDDETTPYMTKFRIKAELDIDCFIEPALTILDLTKDNFFTYTNAKGEKRTINIKGERVKSNACELLAFSIVDPELPGIVNKAKKTVSIITAEDLSSCLAKYQVSPHATIEAPDPATEALDYNEGRKIVVVAHDGKTKAEYIVEKAVPEKIDRGFNASSVELLFNVDPVTNFGMPPYNVEVGPTMAYTGNKLVVCLGNGDTPKYFNALNGVVEGEINLGSASAGSITSDEEETMLIVNKANGGETVNIYTTNSVKNEPVLFHSFNNPSTFPVGHKIKVNGKLSGDALIAIPTEGISGVSSTNEVVMVQVKDGAVVGESSVTLPISWGAAPVNTAGVAAASSDPADGIFASMYDPSFFDLFLPNGSNPCHLGSDSSGWGLNPNCVDAKSFNNNKYVVLFVVSHFPAWGMGPELYLMDVTDPSRLQGDNVYDEENKALILAKNNIKWYQEGDYSIASGDVLIAPSKDGFKINIFYYDHNSQVVGGYTADCIKQ